MLTQSMKKEGETGINTQINDRPHGRNRNYSREKNVTFISRNLGFKKKKSAVM